MSDLNTAQRRAIIEAALDLLATDLTGLTQDNQSMRHEVCSAIEATLGDNCKPDAVTRLLLAMAEASRIELLRQAGLTIEFDDDALAQWRSDGETLQ